MKHRLSISIDEDLVPEIRALMRSEHYFKNKSQVVEYAIKDLVRRRKESS